MFRTIVIVASAVTAMSMADMTAQAQHSTATDFSSARVQRVQRAAPVRAAPVRAAPARRIAPRNVGGARNFGGNKSFSNKPSFSGNKSAGGNKNLGGNKNVKTNVNINRNTNIGRVGAAGVGRIGVGPGRVNANFVRPANIAGVRLAGGRFAPVWRAGAARRIWWGGGWRVWAPLTALGAVVIAGSYYWPDAYLATARPYCEGITPDGCRLNWQMVDFEGGGGDWQCVQYCPRAGAAPPPRTVALVAPPAMAQGNACEMSIFSEPNFTGTNATANTEQPRLGEIGWQNQIASVRVAAGTWDFFSDPEFTGDTMRLKPGEYGDLGPQWSKHSGSFMCVQP